MIIHDLWWYIENHLPAAESIKEGTYLILIKYISDRGREGRKGDEE